MRKRGLFFFFAAPMAGILVLFSILTTLNRAFVQRRTGELVREQLQASARILETSFVRLLETGMAPQAVVDRYAGDADIYYLALLDEGRRVLGWASRFEGFLPLSKETPAGSAPYTIDSPAGAILNVERLFALAGGSHLTLTLGYSLARLEEILAHSRRNALLLLAALAAGGGLLFAGIYRMHRHSLARAEEAMAERKEKERFRELSAFTAGIAHEIKNPLNGLALLLDLLDKKVPDGPRDDIALGRTEVQKIARIVDQLSAALHPVTLRPQPVRADEIVRGVLESLGPAARDRGVTLQSEGAAGLYLEADPALLSLALLNVVRNGLESVSARAVLVRLEDRKGRVVLIVDDDGIGIPAEERERIFEPFHSTKPDGLGIGLFLARKIVEAHEGTVSVEARKAGGARFILDLPEGGRT